LCFGFLSFLITIQKTGVFQSLFGRELNEDIHDKNWNITKFSITGECNIMPKRFDKRKHELTRREEKMLKHMETYRKYGIWVLIPMLVLLVIMAVESIYYAWLVCDPQEMGNIWFVAFVRQFKPQEEYMGANIIVTRNVYKSGYLILLTIGTLLYGFLLRRSQSISIKLWKMQQTLQEKKKEKKEKTEEIEKEEKADKEEDGDRYLFI
jgi:hypothetical protein